MNTEETLRKLLRDVCESAMRYDQAIFNSVQRPAQHQKKADGSTFVESDDLDTLFADWVEKAEKGLEFLDNFK